MGDARPLHQPALAEHDVELVDPLQVLCLGQNHQFRVAAGPYEREGAQQQFALDGARGGRRKARAQPILVVRP